MVVRLAGKHLSPRVYNFISYIEVCCFEVETVNVYIHVALAFHCWKLSALLIMIRLKIVMWVAVNDIHVFHFIWKNCHIPQKHVKLFF
jgi:hypothetical protein